MDSQAEMWDRETAYALLRATIGVNIAMHGISRLIAGLPVFESELQMQFAHTYLAGSFITGFAAFLPWCEAIIGFVVLIGLRTREALIAGALLMIALTFGSCVVEDWGPAGIQLIYALVYALLLFLRKYNGWSVDAMFHRPSA